MSHADTRLPKEEIERQERVLTAHVRPYSLFDPTTWSFRARCGAYSLSLSALSVYGYNRFFKLPWYYGLGYRVITITGVAGIAYFFGYTREHHLRSRDAVLDHYMQLHPEEFLVTNDYYGRPYGSIMMPYYPRRAKYSSHHKIDNSDFY